MGADEKSVSDLLGTVIRPVEERASDVGVAADPPSGPVVEDEAEYAPENPSNAVSFVYVPVQPRKPDSDGETVMFELRSIDGEPGLAVYTSQERLVAELGRYQPHVRVPVLHLLVQLAHQKVSVAVDPALEPGAERWTEEAIRIWHATGERE